MLLGGAEPQIKRWTREEFYALAEEGYFRGKRVQLIDGEIIETAPQGHAHSRAITYLNRWAWQSFGDDYIVRIQMPLNASAWSDPEPDVAVVPGPLGAYSDHPETALLAIEVSDSSVRLDRRKAKIYADAGVQEYWIVNLPESQVEVYRLKAGQREYDDPVVYGRGEATSPLSRPQATLSVSDLLE
jgi:Uma2 family endonuclease